MADTVSATTASVPHIVKARHAYRGMRTAEHYFEVPLDHFGAGGETITVFAREYVSADHSEEAAAALPWLLYLRRRLGARVHFWPFDGWAVPAGRSAIVEVYPRLWSGSFVREDRTGDQHDAYAVAAWLRAADLQGTLAGFLDPHLAPAERTRAEIEGWILGVR